MDHLDQEEGLFVLFPELLEFLGQRKSIEHSIAFPEVHPVACSGSKGNLISVLFAVALIVQVKDFPVLPEQGPPQVFLPLLPVGNHFVLDCQSEQRKALQIQIHIGQFGLDGDRSGSQGPTACHSEIGIKIFMLCVFEVGDELLELRESRIIEEILFGD